MYKTSMLHRKVGEGLLYRRSFHPIQIELKSSSCNSFLCGVVLNKHLSSDKFPLKIQFTLTFLHHSEVI